MLKESQFKTAKSGSKSLKGERCKGVMVTQATLDTLREIAESRKLTVAALVRSETFRRMEAEPLRALPPPPPEDKLKHLAQVSPDAIVYTIPINGTKVICSAHPESGWRGLIFDPTTVGTIGTWHSENLDIPLWARTPNIGKCMLFIASRIDEGGLAHFQIPLTKLIVTAKWDGHHFTGGEVIDSTSDVRQRWERAGWYCVMPLGPYSPMPNVKRMLNLLCKALRAGDGALDVIVPA